MWEKRKKSAWRRSIREKKQNKNDNKVRKKCSERKRI